MAEISCGPATFKPRQKSAITKLLRTSQYAAGLLIAFADMDSYTDSMEDILVYTAFKECRSPPILLNQVEGDYLQAFGSTMVQPNEGSGFQPLGRPTLHVQGRIRKFTRFGFLQ